MERVKRKLRILEVKRQRETERERERERERETETERDAKRETERHSTHIHRQRVSERGRNRWTDGHTEMTESEIRSMKKLTRPGLYQRATLVTFFNQQNPNIGSTKSLGDNRILTGF